MTTKRNTRKAKSKPESTEPESLLKRIGVSCGKALTALDECIERVAKDLGTAQGSGYDKDLASHLAWLTKNVAQIGGEVRKMESHEQKSGEITPRQLSDHFRKATPEEREQWIRELTALDAQGSVLG